MRKEFKIEYREKIENGEYEVETLDGRSVRIVCWDATPDVPICAIVEGQPTMYYEDGKIAFRRDGDKDDLFVVNAYKYRTTEELVRNSLLDAFHLGSEKSDLDTDSVKFARLVERTVENAKKLNELARDAMEYGYGEIAESLYNADDMYIHATSTEEELDALEMAKEALRGLDIWAKLESSIFNSGWAECDKRKGK